MRKQWILWYACLLHLLWGGLLVLSLHPTGSTPVSGMYILFREQMVLASVLITASLLAAWSLYANKPSGWTVLRLMPQQFLMIVSAVASIQAAAQGAYADGVLRPAGFITADQLPNILGAVMHTVAIIDIHREGPWTRA